MTFPSLITKARLRAIMEVPRVVMKEGIFPFVTMIPCSHPKPTPTARPISDRRE